jgi:dCMP deaminase
MEIAEIWSLNSYAKKLKVGAIIVKDGSIISDGYNGTPSGFDNTCEDFEGNTYAHVLHAEANAITKLAKSTRCSAGATIYTLVVPCIQCAKLIIQSGIIRVVYRKEYRSSEGVKLLIKAGVTLTKI